MLGPNGRFIEAHSHEVPLSDDDPYAMSIVLSITYLRFNGTSHHYPSLQAVLRIVILCDNYVSIRLLRLLSASGLDTSRNVTRASIASPMYVLI